MLILSVTSLRLSACMSVRRSFQDELMRTGMHRSNDQTWEEIKDPAVEVTRTVLSAAAKESSQAPLIHGQSMSSSWYTQVSSKSSRSRLSVYRILLLSTVELKAGTAAMSDWLVPVANQVYSEETWNPITDEQAANLHNTLPYEYESFPPSTEYRVLIEETG